MIDWEGIHKLENAYIQEPGLAPLRRSKIKKKQEGPKSRPSAVGGITGSAHHRRTLESSLLLYTALITLHVRIDSYILSILLDFVCQMNIRGAEGDFPPQDFCQNYRLGANRWERKNAASDRLIAPSRKRIKGANNYLHCFISAKTK